MLEAAARGSLVIRHYSYWQYILPIVCVLTQCDHSVQKDLSSKDWSWDDVNPETMLDFWMFQRKQEVMLYYEKFPLFIPVVAAIFCVFFLFHTNNPEGIYRSSSQ